MSTQHLSLEEKLVQLIYFIAELTGFYRLLEKQADFDSLLSNLSTIQDIKFLQSVTITEHFMQGTGNHNITFYVVFMSLFSDSSSFLHRITKGLSFDVTHSSPIIRRPDLTRQNNTDDQDIEMAETQERDNVRDAE